MIIELKVRRTCEYCKGKGIVQHPAWGEFWKHHDPYTKWSRDYADYVDRWFLEKGYDKVPPEEIDCPVCEDGYIESWMSLEALKNLEKTLKE